MRKINVIKRPIFTEKSLQKAAKGLYTFEVDLKTNKRQAARGVEKAFGVDVVDVKTRLLKGKRVRIRGTRLEKLGKKQKTATVKIASGQKITAFEVGKGAS